VQDSRQHYKLVIGGRVQGVGYRAFTAALAQKMGLTGYVKNRPDGSVIVEVEGSEELLEHFVVQCRKGPGWAHVRDITVTKAPLAGYKGFEVRY
jgi:acylphosphatase